MSYQPPIINNTSSLSESGKTAPDILERWRGVSFWGISEKSLIDFTRGLAVMLKAKLTLVQALNTAISQSTDRKLKEVLKTVYRDVNKGESLAKGFSKHPSIFDSYYIHLVEVGEAAGILDEILFRLADYMGKTYRLKQKVKMAMIYPAMVLSVAMVAILFLLLLIVPTFAEMYRDFNAELPELTKMVLSASNWLSGNTLALVLGVVLSVTAGHFLMKNERVCSYVDRLKLNIPVWGSLYRQTLVARFCKTLGTLLTSGVVLVDGLSIMKKSSANMILKREIRDLINSVSRGRSLEKALMHSEIFPPMVLQMITVGEETAELDSMLLEISDFLDEETDLKIQSATAIIEPALIIFLGIVLGFLVIALYLPMFNLMNVIG